jgi:hypothetical protein
MIGPLRDCSRYLEASGAAVLHRQPARVVGSHLVQAGHAISPLSMDVADRMVLAGNNLQEIVTPPKPAGPNWMKQQQQGGGGGGGQ